MSRPPNFIAKGTYEVVEDFISNNANHLEGLLGGDRVYQHVAMNADEVLRVEYTVLILQDFVIGRVHGFVTCAKQNEHLVAQPICLPDQRCR